MADTLNPNSDRHGDPVNNVFIKGHDIVSLLSHLSNIHYDIYCSHLYLILVKKSSTVKPNLGLSKTLGYSSHVK